MSTILDNVSKFYKLGNLSCDDTLKMEIKIQKQFLQLHKRKFLSKEIYEKIHPVDSQWSWMYGLPKVHKTNTPLRPIFFNVWFSTAWVGKGAGWNPRFCHSFILVVMFLTPFNLYRWSVGLLCWYRIPCHLTCPLCLPTSLWMRPLVFVPIIYIEVS